MSERRFYVVAYDISNDKRRTKVHKILSGFGEWTQYSLFEMFLNEKEWVLLQNKLRKVLDGQNDRVRFYPLCALCFKQVKTVGLPPPEEPTVYVV